jgi:hypothetical protein
MFTFDALRLGRPERLQARSQQPQLLCRFELLFCGRERLLRCVEFGALEQFLDVALHDQQAFLALQRFRPLPRDVPRRL